jgi:hypothetical protein
LARGVGDGLARAAKLQLDRGAAFAREVVGVRPRVAADLVTGSGELTADAARGRPALEVLSDHEEGPAQAQLTEELGEADHAALPDGVGRGGLVEPVDAVVEVETVDVDVDGREPLCRRGHYLRP